MINLLFRHDCSCKMGRGLCLLWYYVMATTLTTKPEAMPQNLVVCRISSRVVSRFLTINANFVVTSIGFGKRIISFDGQTIRFSH